MMVSWVGSAPRIVQRRPRGSPQSARPHRATTPDSAISHAIAAIAIRRQAGAARGRARRSLDERRQLSGPARRFAEPERNGRRRAMGIGDADHAAGDLQDAPRAVAELKDVAGVAFDREVFVQRAEERLVGIEHDPVIGDVWNGAARSQRRHARRSLREHAAVHLVAMDQAAAPSAPRRETLGEHPHHRVEVRARQVAVRPRAPRPSRTGRLPATRGSPPRRRSAARARRAARRTRISAIELAPPDRRQQRRAFDQVVARLGKQAALRRAMDGVAGAADALQQRGDAPRRSDLAHQIDVADVDAELERRRRDHDAERCRTSGAARHRAAALSTGCRGARRPASSPSRSASCRARRSAILRVLTNTSVVRCSRISAAMRS